MKILLNSQQRQSHLDAVILVGNPELFIWLVLLEAYVNRIEISVVVNRLQKQVQESNHPALITVHALLQGDAKGYSPALQHYTLQHRMKRCLAYFPLLARKMKLDAPLLTLEQVSQVNKEDFEHLILTTCGIETWTARDLRLRSLFNLTEDNYLLALEGYVFHYGMSNSLQSALEKASVARMTDAQVNAWLGLLMAAGQMTYVTMHRIVTNRKLGNVELLTQCLLMFDEYQLMSRLAGLIPDINPMKEPVINPHVIQQVKAEIPVIHQNLMDRVSSKLRFRLKQTAISLGFATLLGANIYLNRYIYPDLSVTSALVTIAIMVPVFIGAILLLIKIYEHDLQTIYNMPFYSGFSRENRMKMADDMHKILDRFSLLSAIQCMQPKESSLYFRAMELMSLLDLRSALSWDQCIEIHRRAYHINLRLDANQIDPMPYLAPVRRSEAEFRALFFSIHAKPDDIIQADHGDIEARDLESVVLSQTYLR